MELKSDIKDGVVTITLTGKMISGVDASILYSEVHKYIDKKNINFIFDFEKVIYIDATGLGTLISMLEVIKNAKGKLIFCNISPIKHTLIMTHLINVFEHSESLKEAKASFKQ